jgi:hypothetical protein
MAEHSSCHRERGKILTLKEAAIFNAFIYFKHLFMSQSQEAFLKNFSRHYKYFKQS